MDFFERLEQVCQEKQSLLCVGLDPRLEVQEGDDVRAKIVEFNQRIIEATLPFAAAYKPNIAFYEAWGPEGLSALEDTLNLLPEGVPIILDAKRGDIGPTAEAYARAAYRLKGVDCVTVSPYMGRDAVDPFLKISNKAVFVLARTSNPSASELQDFRVKKEPLYLRAARVAASWDRRVGLVVAGNDREALTRLRQILPDTWFLAPGIGAQGGTVQEACSAGLRRDGLGLLVVVAREIANASDPAGAARRLRDGINEARHQALANRQLGQVPMSKLKRKLLRGLIRTECFRLGEFTLKSGIKSPFYIDLRRVSSDPKVLRLAGKAYAELARNLSFRSLAGIPVAALPLASAASLELNKPLIYPRIPPKAHGTGNAIEGDWKPGDKVLLLDDLITTGKSKEEAIDVLRSEGLIVEDLVVLLERGAQGRQDMEARGVHLHAYARVEEFFEVAHELGLIDDAKKAELIAFARAN
ncbi:MAG: orotidine-5'-phosphate decarboxylase [Spirochaetales bacterium]|nr:orotidine-5'-phosphate decarboxylase [Spirochaetales bacterium]